MIVDVFFSGYIQHFCQPRESCRCWLCAGGRDQCRCGQLDRWVGSRFMATIPQQSSNSSSSNGPKMPLVAPWVTKPPKALCLVGGYTICVCVCLKIWSQNGGKWGLQPKFGHPVFRLTRCRVWSFILGMQGKPTTTVALEAVGGHQLVDVVLYSDHRRKSHTPYVHMEVSFTLTSWGLWSHFNAQTFGGGWLYWVD